MTIREFPVSPELNAAPEPPVETGPDETVCEITAGDENIPVPAAEDSAVEFVPLEEVLVEENPVLTDSLEATVEKTDRAPEIEPATPEAAVHAAAIIVVAETAKEPIRNAAIPPNDDETVPPPKPEISPQPQDEIPAPAQLGDGGDDEPPVNEVRSTGGDDEGEEGEARSSGTDEAKEDEVAQEGNNDVPEVTTTVPETDETDTEASAETPGPEADEVDTEATPEIAPIDQAEIARRIERYKAAYEERDLANLVEALADGNDPTSGPDCIGYGSDCAVFRPYGSDMAIKVPHDIDKTASYDEERTPQAAAAERIEDLARAEGQANFEQPIAYNPDDGVVVTEFVPGRVLNDLTPDEICAIPDEHIDEALESIKQAHARGVRGQWNSTNIIYEATRGFTVIDYFTASRASTPEGEAIKFLAQLGVCTSRELALSHDPEKAQTVKNYFETTLKDRVAAHITEDTILEEININAITLYVDEELERITREAGE